MNIKRLIGANLTFLGLIGLIYPAVILIQFGNENNEIKTLIIYVVLGLICFLSGMAMVRATKDEP